MAERVGFEPTCPLQSKLISSQPRYDRFDTPPGYFHPELPSASWREKQERKQKVRYTPMPRNPSKIKGFQNGSSKLPARFRVSPVMTTSIPLQIYFTLILLWKLERKSGEKPKNTIRSRAPEAPIKPGVPEKGTPLGASDFESAMLWPHRCPSVSMTSIIQDGIFVKDE